MVSIINKIDHWFQVNVDSLTIFAGGMTGALWKVRLYEVAKDIWTLQNIEGAIIVALKAFIGAFVAWAFKRVCNHLTRKKISKK